MKVVADTGDLVWAKRFGSTGNDTAQALAAGPMGEVFLSVGGAVDLGASYSDAILLLMYSGEVG